jgi:hypothetical protein
MGVLVMGLVPSKDDLRPAQQGGVSLWYIATRAGVGDRSDNWVLNYVRELHANESFPGPLPYYDSRKKRPGIHLQSRWLRAAVDAWFDGFLPPHLVTVSDERTLSRDAELLDRAAAELAGELVTAAGGRA